MRPRSAGPRRLPAAALAGAAGLMLALPLTAALAQYRVVGPDGRVTYTDQPQTREQVLPPPAADPKKAPAQPPGDTRALSRRNVLASDPPAPAASSPGGSRAPQSAAGRIQASELIQALNKSLPLNNGLTPAQMRSIILGGATTSDIASGAAGKALARLPAAPAGPPRTLGEDRLEALAPGNGSSAWPAAVRQAVSQRPVVLFSNPACSACGDWQEALRQRGAPAAVFTVSSPGDFAQLQRMTGQTSVPVLAVGGQVVATEATPIATWSQALDRAGYVTSATDQPAMTTAASARPLAETGTAAATLMRQGQANRPSFTP